MSHSHLKHHFNRDARNCNKIYTPGVTIHLKIMSFMPGAALIISQLYHNYITRKVFNMNEGFYMKYKLTDCVCIYERLNRDIRLCKYL